MKKKIITFLVIVLVIVLAIITQRIIFNKIDSENNTNVVAEEENKEKKEDSTNMAISVVPTMSDSISGNSIWCGTFQLVWNEMIDKKVKQDIIFNPQQTMAKNLNKKEFKAKDISEDDYYKTFGLQTKELKETIEKAIKEKFDETSDVLNNVEWYDTEEQAYGKYTAYAILKKIFTFEYNFIDLKPSEFENGAYENIKYFGVKTDTDNKVKRQIEILYYKNNEDFAVELSTKEGENIILCNKPEGDNFKEIYNNINKNRKSYKGAKALGKLDDFKMPNLKFDILRTYDELCGKEFKEKDGTVDKINTAIQTIQLELDKKGGMLKSESITTFESSGVKNNKNKPKHLYLDDSFAMFLVEDGKNTPYYASKITDITKFQK